MTQDLAAKKCRPCEGGTRPMTDEEVRRQLEELPGWALENGEIVRSFNFKNYYETTAFVNAVAWIAHREDHHPDVRFGYKTCRVAYMTHAIKGLSLNDFICAAKVDRLLA